MLPLKKAITSTLGRKFIMSLTGFGLVIFVIGHLLGNLQLLKSDQGAAFNQYTETLASFGIWLYVIEAGLAAVFLFHMITAVWLKIDNWRARPERYRYAAGTKGGPSKKNVSSTTMIYTGLVIGVFLVLHIWQFKFGPSFAEGYVTQVQGQEVRDLYRLVVETFQNPLWTGLYVAVMIFLGFHLRHGFWSAFQTSAIGYARFSRPIYLIGVVVAVLLAVGFLFVPLWIYFDLSKVLL